MAAPVKASACLRPRLVGTVASICAQVKEATKPPTTALETYHQNETR